MFSFYVTYRDGGASLAAKHHAVLLSLGSESKVGLEHAGGLIFRLLRRVNALLAKLIVKKHSRQSFSFNFFAQQKLSNSSSSGTDVLHWTADGYISHRSRLAPESAIVLHDLWYLTGGCHFELDCAEFPNCEKCPQIRRPFRFLFQYQLNQKRKFLEQNNPVIIATNENTHRYVADYNRARGLCLRSGVVPIPNGHSQVPFQVVPRQRRFVVPAYSLNDYRKGLDLLLDALDFVDEQVTLVFLGRDTPSLRKYLEARTPKNITLEFSGYLHEKKEVGSLFQSATGVLIPSRQETLPNVVIEALYHGAPVVCFDVGGHSCVVNQSNGVLVTPFDTKAFGCAIDLVSTGTFDYEAIHESIAIEFSDEVITSRLRTILGGCLDT